MRYVQSQFPDCNGPCIDLRWLLSRSLSQELGLGECKKFDTVLPDCHGPCIDLRRLLSGSMPQELSLGECQKFDTVTVP